MRAETPPSPFPPLLLVFVLEKLCDEQQVREFLYGAFLVFQGDRGHLYEKTRRSGVATVTRRSSHKSTQPQLRLSVPAYPEVLVGTRSDGSSWLQLERSKSNSVSHLADYVWYRITGHNIGPLGMSAYTEERPLRIPEDCRQILSPGCRKAIRLVKKKTRYYTRSPADLYQELFMSKTAQRMSKIYR